MHAENTRPHSTTGIDEQLAAPPLTISLWLTKPSSLSLLCSQWTDIKQPESQWWGLQTAVEAASSRFFYWQLVKRPCDEKVFESQQNYVHQIHCFSCRKQDRTTSWKVLYGFYKWFWDSLTFIYLPKWDCKHWNPSFLDAFCQHLWTNSPIYLQKSSHDNADVTVVMGNRAWYSSQRLLWHF